MANNKTKELTEVGGALAPDGLIQQAIEGKADLDKLERLLIIKERHEANEARKAYHKAMAEFKTDPPKIDKDKTVSYKTNAGTTTYNHATLANVTEKINAALSKYGLSASWKTQQNGQIIVTCKITHELGHSEETSLSAASDTSGSKNAIQAIGSTITYLERYTLLALTGLATYEQDDDGKASGPVEHINKQQEKQILDAVVEVGIDKQMFLDYMKIETLKKMPKAEFQKAMNAIDAARKRKAKKT